ncbi:MAG: sigma-70 family RNA polymerase sigma factor [bacterium]
MIPTEQQESDERLVARFMGNRPDAIATIAGWVRVIAEHRAWGFDTPDDIVQASLLVLVRNLKAGRYRAGNFQGYVRQIARNLCISSYRRQQRRGIEVPLPENGSPANVLDAQSISPDQLTFLRWILENLDDSCRRLITSAYLDGLSRKEIAEQLDISVGAAKVRLFRCLKKAHDLSSGHRYVVDVG